MVSKTIIRLAIQKSGRLSEDSEELIRSCGVRITRLGERLKASSTNFPLEIIFLRDDDIPEYVSNGVADIGIVGENLVQEKTRPLAILESLRFSKCRLSIAIPREEVYDGPSSLAGKTIATTYVNSLRTFLEQNQIDATIREIKGSTEIAPTIGLADAICDLVSSGSTLLSHGLKEVEVLLNSQAVLVANQELNDEKLQTVNELLFRMRSVLLAQDSKYILMNVPNESVEQVVSLLPGLRSPSIFPLAESGWSAVHTVINENDFWEKIGQLKEAGAEGILVNPIEKMIA